jgi:hypothetical protein
MLADIGMSDFSVRYHNLTPGLFINMPLSGRLWDWMHRLDPSVAGSLTRWACDAGVLSCRRRA